MTRLTFAAVATALASLTLSAIAQATPPTISGVGFSEVTTTSVTLEAAINPNGKATKYHFEYGVEDCEANPCTQIPFPEEGKLPLPAGTSPEAVSAKVEGLAPATTYHFRLIAKSTGTGGGETKGPDTTFTTYHPSQVFPPCPANEAFRKGSPSAALPDCRAYEQASPVQKNGLDARGRVAFAHASLSGERISFVTSNGLAQADGAQAVPVYLASREGGGWLTQGLLPPASFGQGVTILGWSADFSQVFETATRFIGGSDATLLSRESDSGTTTTIVPYGEGLVKPPAAQAAASQFAGAAGSLALFESTLAIASVPGAIEGKPNLYLWDRDTDTLSLAGVMNDGTAPAQGALAGPYDWIAGTNPKTLGQGGAGAVSGISYYTQDQRVLSDEGTRLFFTVAGTGQLYVRLNPEEPQSPLDGEGKCTDTALACTVRLSASQKDNGAGPDGTDGPGPQPAAFLGATADGKTALFSSSEKLTNDANTGPEVQPATIARSNPDGSGKSLGFLPAHAKGLAVFGERIYWANPADGTIGRAKLNGEEPEPEFITDIGRPQYVAVDSEHVYWTDAERTGKEEGTIGRADLDGSGSLVPASVETDFIIGATNPQGIDTDSEYVYWANAGSELPTRTVGRAKLDGSETNESFVPVDFGQQQLKPEGLAADSTHVYVGVVDVGDGSSIYRWDIDGDAESRQSLFDGTKTNIKDVALDSTYLYWAREGGDAIGRIPIADFGTTVVCTAIPSCELNFIAEAGHPIGIAADPGHLFWSANQEVKPHPGNDLYRWQYDEATGTGNLTDLAPLPGGKGADVLGLLGTSEDASTVYFAANGDLDGAGPAEAGDCQGTVVSIAVNYTGKCGLYVAREGEPIEYIARLDSDGGGFNGDAIDWMPRGLATQRGKFARISADGSTLLFRSHEQLTAYDNRGVAELYRYREGEGIGCVSCNPTGEAPTGPPGYGSIDLAGTLFPQESSYTLSRNLSADGNRVFFETTDALVSEDTNGKAGCPTVGPALGAYPVCLDAYEWEAKGTDSCTEDIQAGGCLYLLSSGKSADASYLFDASASGDHVFLATRDPFVFQDKDQLYDVYDAHIDGGLASQHPTQSSPCEAEGCKPAPTPPPAGSSAGSASFQGPADPKPSHKRKRSHRKQSHRKHKQSHSKQRQQRHNRGARR